METRSYLERISVGLLKTASALTIGSMAVFVVSEVALYHSKAKIELLGEISEQAPNLDLDTSKYQTQHDNYERWADGSLYGMICTSTLVFGAVASQLVAKRRRELKGED